MEESTTSVKRDYKIRLDTLRFSAKRPSIVTINYEHCTMQNEDSSRQHRASWIYFTEYKRGRISGEIICVLENAFDLIIIAFTFSEISSIL